MLEMEKKNVWSSLRYRTKQGTRRTQTGESSVVDNSRVVLVSDIPKLTPYTMSFVEKKNSILRRHNRVLLGNTWLFHPPSLVGRRLNLIWGSRAECFCPFGLMLHCSRDWKTKHSMWWCFIQRILPHLRRLPEATVWALGFCSTSNFSPWKHFWRRWKLTQSGSSRLRVVAQRLKVWGESSGSVHSSGTAVRCGPLPFSQMYRATWRWTRGHSANEFLRPVWIHFKK